MLSRYSRVDANFLRQSPAGQDVVIDIPEESFLNFQEFIVGFKRISRDLLALNFPDAEINP